MDLHMHMDNSEACSGTQRACWQGRPAVWLTAGTVQLHKVIRIQWSMNDLLEGCQV